MLTSGQFVFVIDMHLFVQPDAVYEIDGLDGQFSKFELIAEGGQGRVYRQVVNFIKICITLTIPCIVLSSQKAICIDFYPKRRGIVF